MIIIIKESQQDVDIVKDTRQALYNKQTSGINFALIYAYICVFINNQCDPFVYSATFITPSIFTYTHPSLHKHSQLCLRLLYDFQFFDLAKYQFQQLNRHQVITYPKLIIYDELYEQTRKVQNASKQSSKRRDPNITMINLLFIQNIFSPIYSFDQFPQTYNSWIQKQYYSKFKTYNFYNCMIDVEKKVVKSVEDYRHSIKLLKYHLKKQKKTNEKFKYQAAKVKHKPHSKTEGKNRVYQLTETVKIISDRLKRMGLILQDVFRMADSQYEGQITKQQFMKVVSKLKTNLTDSVFTEMFHAIDTSMNYLISQDEFLQFSIAYGGCSDPKLIRKYQNKTKTKLLGLIKKKHGSIQNFLSKFQDPIPIEKLNSQLRSMDLSSNQIMIIMKTFDPSHQGFANHKLFISIMQQAKQKTQKQQENEQFTKNVNELCVIWRNKKINPVIIFEEADVDGKDGVSPFELQQAFKKIIPDQTSFQIKKWVNMINSNNDNQITKQQYINSIRGFYSINQLDKFSEDYLKKHPELKLTQDKSQSVQKILKKLRDAIEDKGMKKKQAFDFIDFNKSKDIDKGQLLEGLSSFGLDIGLIGKIISVFDRNGSQSIDLEEWLKILGEDVQMSEVGIQNQINLDDSEQQLSQNKKKDNKKQINKVQNSKSMDKNQKQKDKKLKQEKDKKLKQEKDKKQHKNSINKQKQNSKIHNQDTKKSKDKKIQQSQITKSIAKKPTLKQSSKHQQKQKKGQIKNSQTLKQTTKKDLKNTKNFKQDEIQQKKNQSKIIKKPNKQGDHQKINKKDSSTNKSNQVDQSNKMTKKKSSNLSIKKTQSIIEKQAEPQHIEQTVQRVDQEQENNHIDKVQEQIGIMYKKNKNKVLKVFYQYDKKKSDVLNKNNFSLAMKKLDPNLTQDQVKQVFMKHVVSGNQFNFKEWLDQIAENYAQQVQSDHQEPQAQAQENHQESDKKQQKLHHDQQQEVGILSQQQQKIKKTQDLSKKQKLEKSKNKQKSSNNISKQKRGEQLTQFKELDKLKPLEQGKSNNNGYKLIDYISDQEKQLSKKRQQLLKKAKQIKVSKKIFQDTDFPHNQKSLTPNAKKSCIKNVQLIKWKHYKDIYKNPVLFHGQIQPNDIKQGGLGDCYFLSALACLAQYNNLIQRLFQYFDIQNGYFLIWLCIDGSWRLVQVDGYLPCKSNSQIAFSRSDNQQLWVSLLQKAYAKCYGNYQHIAGGQPIQAIRDLTGAPGNIFQFQKNINKQNPPSSLKRYSMQQVWEKLYQADNLKYMMAAGTELKQLGVKIQGHEQDITKQGIVLGHAYSILDCRQLNKQKILKMRNPWGQIQWNASDWSDKGKKWTEKLKKQLNYQTNQNDGIFWIQLENFFRHFLACSINYIRPTFYFRSDKILKVKNFLVTTTNSFNVGYLMVNHRDHRHQGIPINTAYDGEYSLLGFIYKEGKVVKKYNEKRYFYERQGCIQFNQMSKLGQNCQAIMLVTLSKTTDVTVGYYGDKYCDFGIQFEYKPYLQKLAYYNQNIEKQPIDSFGLQIWQPRVQDIQYICFKNTTDKMLTVKTVLKNPVNVNPIPPQGLQNTFKINPQQIQSVKLKISKDPKYSFSYSAQ